MTEPANSLKKKETEIPQSILKAALDIWEDSGQQRCLPIIGRSMLPLLRHGDQAWIEHGCANPHRGEIIVFRDENKLTIHRIIRLSHDSGKLLFITKGDNFFKFDAPVTPEQILGRVVAVQRGKQRIMIDTPAWRMVGWSIAVVTLLWTKIYNVCRTGKQAVFGTQPNRVTAFLRESALSFFSLMRRMVEMILRN